MRQLILVSLLLFLHQNTTAQCSHFSLADLERFNSLSLKEFTNFVEQKGYSHVGTNDSMAVFECTPIKIALFRDDKVAIRGESESFIRNIILKAKKNGYISNYEDAHSGRYISDKYELSYKLNESRNEVLVTRKTGPQCFEFSISDFEKMCNLSKSDLKVFLSKKGYSSIGGDTHLTVYECDADHSFYITSAPSIGLKDKPISVLNALISQAKIIGYQDMPNSTDILYMESKKYSFFAYKDEKGLYVIGIEPILKK